MAMKVNLPNGFGHVNFFFGGVGLPTGAACSFGLGGAGAPNTPAGLAAELIGYWTTRLKAQTSISVSLTGCRVKLGPMETGPFALVGASVAGSAAGTAVSPAVAYIVRKNSAMGGKRGSGRFFHPGSQDPKVNEAGVIDAPTLTALQAAWDGFMGDLAASTLEMVLLHTYGTYVKQDGTTVVVPAQDPTPVTSLTVEAMVGTQRRRQRR